MPNPALLVLLGVAVVAAIYLRFGTGTEEEPVPAATPQPAAQSAAQSPPTPAESSAPATSSQSAVEPDTPPVSSATGSPDSLPESVITELGSGKTVMLLFWTSGNSEDIAVRESVDSVRSGPLKDAVAVHIEPPERVAEYSLVSKDILQTPAVVIVNPALQTKTFQGFTDAESIQQAVKDLQRATAENQSEQK